MYFLWADANTYDFKVVSETILPLQDSSFSLESPDWNITTSNISVVADNGFSDHQGLTFELRFKRDMSGHLMHFYLPSMILCASSMMSLFIPLDVKLFLFLNFDFKPESIFNQGLKSDGRKSYQIKCIEVGFWSWLWVNNDGKLE